MKLTITAFFTSVNLMFFAQENSLKTNENHSQDQKLIVHAEYGFSEGNYFILPDEYWLTKIPTFTFPADSLGFNKSNSSNFGIFVNSIVKLSFEKELKSTFLNKKNITSTIGLTMGIGARNYSGLNFYKNTREIIDTLTSSQTGSMYYVYENKSEFKEAAYFSNSAIFGVKSMNRTNMKRRLSLGIGFEFAYGFSYNNKVVYNYGQNSYLENSLPNMYTNSTYNSSVFDGPFIQSLLFNFPIEIAVRIQKKEGGVFENSAITLNTSPSLNWSFVEKTQIFNGIMNYGIGFRQVF